MKMELYYKLNLYIDLHCRILGEDAKDITYIKLNWDTDRNPISKVKVSVINPVFENTKDYYNLKTKGYNSLMVVYIPTNDSSDLDEYNIVDYHFNMKYGVGTVTTIAIQKLVDYIRNNINDFEFQDNFQFRINSQTYRIKKFDPSDEIKKYFNTMNEQF